MSETFILTYFHTYFHTDTNCDTHSCLRKFYLIHCSFILSRSLIWVVLDLHLSDQHMGLQRPGPCPSDVAVLSLVCGCCPLLLPTLSCSSACWSFLIVCQALLMVSCRCWIFLCYCKHPWALFLGVVKLLWSSCFFQFFTCSFARWDQSSVQSRAGFSAPWSSVPV